MEIVVHGDKIKVTQAMHDYIEEKLSKLEKYLENSDNVKAKVIVKVKNNEQIVEITIPLKKFILRSEEKQEDFYAAVDKTIDKLERQIRKQKTKMMSKQVKPAIEFNFAVIEEYFVDDDDEEDKQILKRKKIEVKPMSEEEAILQMELLGHQFYMYKDQDTDKPAVVYKRKDGNYGVLESE